MLSGVVRTAGVTVFAAMAIAYLFAPRGVRPLDPNEPIAADGSMVAGRAHTIYDTAPMPGSYGSPRSDSDNPADFEPLMKADRPTIEFDRSMFAGLLPKPLDSSLCKEREHGELLLAVRTYYGERGREKRAFALRGPQARAAIERVWSTPADRDIDGFVLHAVQYGLLHKSEMANDPYGEFARTFGDIRELGTGCTKADNR
jgi:hypothetical protein